MVYLTLLLKHITTCIKDHNLPHVPGNTKLLCKVYRLEASKRLKAPGILQHSQFIFNGLAPFSQYFMEKYMWTNISLATSKPGQSVIPGQPLKQTFNMLNHIIISGRTPFWPPQVTVQTHKELWFPTEKNMQLFTSFFCVDKSKFPNHSTQNNTLCVKFYKTHKEQSVPQTELEDSL